MEEACICDAIYMPVKPYLAVLLALLLALLATMLLVVLVAWLLALGVHRLVTLLALSRLPCIHGTHTLYIYRGSQIMLNRIIKRPLLPLGNAHTGYHITITATSSVLWLHDAPFESNHLLCTLVYVNVHECSIYRCVIYPDVAGSERPAVEGSFVSPSSRRVLRALCPPVGPQFLPCPWWLRALRLVLLQ